MSVNHNGARRGFLDRLACLIGFHDWKFIHWDDINNVGRVCRSCNWKEPKNEPFVFDKGAV